MVQIQAICSGPPGAANPPHNVTVEIPEGKTLEDIECPECKQKTTMMQK